MDTNDKTLNIFLKFALDSNAAGRVKSGVTTIENELDRLQRTSLETKQALMDVSEGAKRLGQNFTKAFAVGTAITGGIFAFAENYVRNAKAATATTKEWAEQNERLARSKNRIGEVVAKEALPTLKMAADLTEKIAGFIERNPDIVNAAIKGGMIIATVGAIGKLVTTGVKLYADAKMIAVGAQQIIAGRLMIDAANKQLEAAVASKMGGGEIAQNLRGSMGLAPAAAGSVTAGTIALAAAQITAGVIAAGALVVLVNQLLEKTGINQKIRDAQEKARDNNARVYPMLINDPKQRQLQVELNKAIAAGDENKIKRLREEIEKLGSSSEETAGKLGAKGSVSPMLVNVTDTQRQIVDAYVKMLEEEKQATEQYARDRMRIIRESNSRIADMFRNNATTNTRIIENYNKQVSSITAAYQKANAQSEQNYQRQRAQVIQSAGTEIRRIEEDHQERLRKLLQEHNDRVTDLVSSRDALGLVREMRDYERQRAEEEANTNKEIARRRQDLAQTLRDMAAQHAAERAQRLADYKQQLKDAEEQKKEQLKLQADQFKEQVAQAQKARQDALRALSDQYKAEQERRRAAFVAQVKDLDASLQNEQKRKQTWYAAMLKDVDAFMSAWKSKINGDGQSGTKSGGTLPIRDKGGYATKGVYGLAQDGRTEFVLSGPTTRAAEQVIGAQLTQDNLIAALRQGGRSVVWNDHRRFDSRLSLADRRSIQNDTVDLLAGVLS